MKRNLLQRNNADSDELPSGRPIDFTHLDRLTPCCQGYECRLSPRQVDRYLENETRTWSFDDNALESMEDDLQLLINCTQNGDILLFNTERIIRPKARVIVPWPLTLSAAVNDGSEAAAAADVFPLSQTTVQFMCPRDNEGLFLVQ